MESIPESERGVVGEKVTHRLAQRPASYEVLRYALWNFGQMPKDRGRLLD